VGPPAEHDHPAGVESQARILFPGHRRVPNGFA
jgi:hypothetical protein